MDKRPTLFSLMTRLTAEERQKLGERRRALKARDGVVERLVGTAGTWRLEYWSDKVKLGEIVL